MLGITQTQVTSAIRWAITYISAVLAGYLISKGWATTASAADLTTFLLGLAPGIATFIWGLWAHTKSSTIAAASAIPEVKEIVTTPTIANSPQFGPDPKIVAK